MNKNNFAELKDSALLFIAHEQLDDGRFTSITKTEQGDSLSHWTIFYPVLIGSLLPHEINSKPLKNKIINFTREEKGKNFGFQYWSKKDKNSKDLPYPTDLDVTSLVILNCESDRNDVSESISEYILLLTQQELKPGGPYYTWAGNHDGAWGDIDPVVNSAIHFALQKYDVHLNSLENYLVHCLSEDNWRSPYYASAWLNLYLIARSLNSDKQDIVLQTLTDLDKQNPPQNLLDQACKILLIGDYSENILQNFIKINFSPDPAVNEILIPGKKEVSGCAALTAALWSLIWYRAELIHLDSPPTTSTTHEFIRDSAIKIVAQKMNSLVPELRERGIITLADLLTKPVSQEIILLSSDIGSSLTNKLSDELYSILGAANIFGWLAFGMYDECYDEGKISTDLSLANICLRASTKCYEEAAHILEIDYSLISNVLDTIDQAHAEELSDTTEFRNLIKNSTPWPGLTIRQISERSFGHCLGPLLICQSTNLGREFYINLKNLFNHYLTARQMCDDLHDWPTDFSAQRITSVTKSLFLASHAFPNTNQFQAKKIFWNEGLELAIKRTKQELSEARHLMKKIRWPNHPPSLLTASISSLEQSLDKVISERIVMKSLINKFKKYE